MKRAAIIFIILFLATLLIPMISISRNKQEEKTDQLVTIFSSSIYPIDELSFTF